MLPCCFVQPGSSLLSSWGQVRRRRLCRLRSRRYYPRREGPSFVVDLWDGLWGLLTMLSSVASGRPGVKGAGPGPSSYLERRGLSAATVAWRLRGEHSVPRTLSGSQDGWQYSGSSGVRVRVVAHSPSCTVGTAPKQETN
jgi:hypothetical protein